MKRIGIIGLGLLGSAVATRLLKGKFEVKGYDTRREQVEALRAQGLIASGSIAEVSVDTDAVFIILPSLPSVEETIIRAGGLIDTAPLDCTLIQMSTISPELTRRLGAAAVVNGLGFLDFVLAAKGGLEPRKLLEILKESAAASKMLEVRGPLMANHRFDAQMKIDLFLKDFKLILEEGQQLGVSLPLTSITQQLATATAVAGYGEEDLAAIVTTFELLAGLERNRSTKKKE